jgi:ADP-ribose pyrophosphatase YjhB (NUDIX family)
MHKTIYFNNKPLFITNEITKELQEYLQHEDTVYIDDFDFHTVKAMIHEMEIPKIHAGVFLYDDVDAVLKAFKKKLKLIQAAGGVVRTNDHELLLIFRNQKWDLPKGKLDEGESLESCAVREVQEETGLQKIRIEQPVTVTYHTYHQDGKHILKESHWYLMSGDNKSVLTPQTEEGIDKCEWVPIENLAPYMENTHASILDVVNKAIKILHEAKNV